MLIISDAGVSQNDNEIALSRGIDFKSVQCIVNFNEAPDLKSHVHRIGRCGRGGKEGSAISFFNESSTMLEELLEKESIEALQFDPEFLKPLEYRMNDILQNVPKQLVDTSRMQAIRQSALLDEQFIAKINERDQTLLEAVIKNDTKRLKSTKAHLTHLPKYLVTRGLEGSIRDAQQQIGVDIQMLKNAKVVKRSKKGASVKVWKQKKNKREKLPKFKRRKK
ncbi:bifunctional P-loop containing nucleoside triphosphate hydrolase/Helicase [Babesia duncani]|uniref:Bifunctional P-loop containing nucleoside triphosphate hydrolase/Helicase n=1 Tax=Babesia duncani TaxID=323732 RepID=A0AAD9PJX6_9APIC|nr:bifunctional P-loop containing nucleoside triphosphate hydrolase/Helicase [Babesia duncani]